MATPYKVETPCPCNRYHCPGKTRNWNLKFGIAEDQIGKSEPEPTSQRTMQKTPERNDRPEESMARVRAAEYLNTTAEQYAMVASELLVLRQQRQARLTEQLRLMGAVPDVPFDAQVVRGMVGGRDSPVVCAGGSWRRGLSWTRRWRRNEVDAVKGYQETLVNNDCVQPLREVRNSGSRESLAQTVNSIGEKVLAGSACKDTMPYAPPLESVEPPYCGN